MNSDIDKKLKIEQTVRELYDIIYEFIKKRKATEQLFNKALVATIIHELKPTTIHVNYNGYNYTIDITPHDILVNNKRIFYWQQQYFIVFYKHILKLVNNNEIRKALATILNLYTSSAKLYYMDIYEVIKYYRPIKVVNKNNITKLYVETIGISIFSIILNTEYEQIKIYDYSSDKFNEEYYIIDDVFYNKLKRIIAKYKGYYERLKQIEKELLHVAGVYMLSHRLGGENR